MCIPTFFKLEIIDSDDECAHPVPVKERRHRRSAKGVIREEIDVKEEVKVGKRGARVEERVHVDVTKGKGKGKGKEKTCIEEDVRFSTGESSSATNEAVIVEVAPGQVARLHHQRKPKPAAKWRGETTISAAARIAEYWLCPGCEAFIKMSIEICIHCGHRRRRPGSPSPRPIPKEPKTPAKIDPPSTSTPVDVEVDVNASKSSGSVEVEVDVNTLNYERLKKMMLETGTSIAKDVLAEEAKKKCPAPDPPIQIQPVPQPLPYYPIVFPPAPPPSSSTSTSRSSSTVSRRSFDRMRSHVRHLSTRLARLGNRTGALSGDMHGLGSAVRGLDYDVHNINSAVHGLDGTVRGIGHDVHGIGGAVRGLEHNVHSMGGAVQNLEGQVQVNANRASALNHRERGLAMGLGSVRGRVGRVERRVDSLETPLWRARSGSRGRSRLRWDDRERERQREWVEGQRERIEDRREWVEGRRERVEDERERAERWREGLWAGRRGRWR